MSVINFIHYLQHNLSLLISTTCFLPIHINKKRTEDSETIILFDNTDVYEANSRTSIHQNRCYWRDKTEINKLIPDYHLCAKICSKLDLRTKI